MCSRESAQPFSARHERGISRKNCEQHHNTICIQAQIINMIIKILKQCPVLISSFSSIINLMYANNCMQIIYEPR